MCEEWVKNVQMPGSRLPVHLTSLVGRAADLSALLGLLETERLVTLVGSAGVGKTRLAVAIGDRSVGDWAGGVWWVDLSAVRSEEAAANAVMSGLGIRQQLGIDPADSIGPTFGTTRALVIIDNCEHLAAACAKIVMTMLSSVPTMSILTTSREPLGVVGEVAWLVPSLHPDDAATLFRDRVRRVSTDLPAIPPHLVAEICRRLDGIPLALELAAGRVPHLGIEHVVERLDDRFQLLHRNQRAVPARQQTLEASIAWSHKLLDHDERLVFRRLSVFAGPFPRSAAVAVAAGAADLSSEDAEHAIDRLIDKNLVSRAAQIAEAPCYRILESLRAYARVRLEEANEMSDISCRHAVWWAEWIEPRGRLPSNQAQSEVNAFHADIKAALDHSAGEPELGLRLLASVAPLWELLGKAPDAVNAIDQLLTDNVAELHGPQWLEAAGRCTKLEFDARGSEASFALCSRIAVVADRQHDTYHSLLATEDDWNTSELKHMAGAAIDRGYTYQGAVYCADVAIELAEFDPPEAAEALATVRALPEFAQIGVLGEAIAIANGELALNTGHLVAAVDAVRMVLSGTYSRYWDQAVRITSVAGFLMAEEAIVQQAIESAHAALRWSPGEDIPLQNALRRLEMMRGETRPLDPEPAVNFPPRLSTVWLLCRQALDNGQVELARALIQSRGSQSPHEAAIAAAIAGALGDLGEWHVALRRASSHDLRLIAIDSFEGLGAAAAEHGRWTDCLRLLGAAERARSETHYRWRFSREQQLVDAARASAQQALGDQSDAAWTDGQRLDWREAASFANRLRGQRRRPSHGWASLTPTEQRVVDLVVDGRTNPQIAEQLIMGRATVKTHLEHIFRKLGVSTRAELAARATRRSGEGA